MSITLSGTQQVFPLSQILYNGALSNYLGRHTEHTHPAIKSQVTVMMPHAVIQHCAWNGAFFPEGQIITILCLGKILVFAKPTQARFTRYSPEIQDLELSDLVTPNDTTKKHSGFSFKPRSSKQLMLNIITNLYSSLLMSVTFSYWGRINLSISDILGGLLS